MRNIDHYILLAALLGVIMLVPFGVVGVMIFNNLSNKHAPTEITVIHARE